MCGAEPQLKTLHYCSCVIHRSCWKEYWSRWICHILVSESMFPYCFPSLCHTTSLEPPDSMCWQPSGLWYIIAWIYTIKCLMLSAICFSIPYIDKVEKTYNKLNGKSVGNNLVYKVIIEELENNLFFSDIYKLLHLKGLVM